jgi:hypothetical protein
MAARAFRSGREQIRRPPAGAHLHGGLAASADAALFILAEALGRDLVAELDDVLDLLRRGSWPAR